MRAFAQLRKAFQWCALHIPEFLVLLIPTDRCAVLFRSLKQDIWILDFRPLQHPSFYSRLGDSIFFGNYRPCSGGGGNLPAWVDVLSIVLACIWQSSNKSRLCNYRVNLRVDCLMGGSHDKLTQIDRVMSAAAKFDPG